MQKNISFNRDSSFIICKYLINTNKKYLRVNLFCNYLKLRKRIDSIIVSCVLHKVKIIWFFDDQ